MTGYDSSGRVVCKDLCNVIVDACRNLWITLWTDSPNAFINDIPIVQLM